MTPARNFRAVLALALIATGVAPWARATNLRVVTFNIERGLGAPGTASYDATVDVLARIDADVVALQELNDDDLAGNPSRLDTLAATLGYAHLHLTTLDGVFDFMQRVGFLSRYPIRSATNIIPPPSARDMTRQVPAIVVDVPEVAIDPVILNLHLKCCLDDDDPFRRAVELHRIQSHLTARGFTSADHLVVLGDFNLVGFPRTYDTLPSGLPPTFDLGEDVTFPVRYFTSPIPYFTNWSMNALDARQIDRSKFTSRSSILDYILATPALLDRPHASEIYNSALDASNQRGLQKAGEPLPAAVSSTASDHFAVFADFDLGNTPLPALAIALSESTVSESDPPGASNLTITLPAAPGPGQSVTVALSSSDPGEATPAQTSLVFTEGITARSLELIPQPDALLDGDQPVRFTATASGFAPAEAILNVRDVNPAVFAFTHPGQTLGEDFALFDGSADPARWTTSGAEWLGTDLGDSSAPGKYSYGTDPSLGFLPGDMAHSAATECRNASGITITSLQIAFDAEQWRSSPGGAAGTISVALLHDDSVTPLPSLSFTARTDLPPGAVPNGATTSLSTVVTGLSVQAGESFLLRFTVEPGDLGGGPAPDDVFLNELHYDNLGQDADEFVEIVVGPGFRDPLAEISLVLYNGNGGNAYAVHPLDTFAIGETTSSGHRILSLLIPGIQNGSPDGVAIVAGSHVLHFHSYEGSFVASDGPARGMTSTNIGVEQDDPVPAPGTQSLGLTGSGGEAADFSWVRFARSPTPGAPNDGQIFRAPAASQGFAIDNLALTPLLDTDADGLPDLTDPDDDADGLPDDLERALGTDPLLADSDGNGTPDGAEDADRDRQSNLAELLLTATDPRDPNSRFDIRIAPDPANQSGAILSFPTLNDRTYFIWQTSDLSTWNLLESHAGTGSVLSLPVAGDQAAPSHLFRVEVR